MNCGCLRRKVFTLRAALHQSPLTHSAAYVRVHSLPNRVPQFTMYVGTLAQNCCFSCRGRRLIALAAVAPQVTLPLVTIDKKNLESSLKSDLLYEARISCSLTKTNHCPNFCTPKGRQASYFLSPTAYRYVAW
jgi:hypothetical protein